jgi:hypothetical protein
MHTCGVRFALVELATYPPDARRSDPGGMPEWPKGTRCKRVGYAFAGSNPAPTTSLQHHTARAPSAARVRRTARAVATLPAAHARVGARPALVAQSAEHIHGKDGVRGSIPRQGSGDTRKHRRPRPAASGWSPSRRRSSEVEQAAHNRCVGGSSPPAATSSGSTDLLTHHPPGSRVGHPDPTQPARRRRSERPARSRLVTKEHHPWPRRSSSGPSRT